MVFNISDEDINPSVRSLALNSELDIAGDALFRGLRGYYSLQDRRSDLGSAETEVFVFMYQTSIGIERLIKIAHRLLAVEVHNFTYRGGHKIVELHEKTIKYSSMTMRRDELNILQVLEEFYGPGRYSNLDTGPGMSPHSLLKEYMKNHTVDASILGSTFGHLIDSYYRLIEELSQKHGVFSYELRYDSNATKIFYGVRLHDDIFELFKYEHRAFKEFVVGLIALRDAPLSDVGTFLTGIKSLDDTLYSEMDLFELLREFELGNIPMDFVSLVDAAYEELSEVDKKRRDSDMSVFDANLSEGILEDIE